MDTNKPKDRSLQTFNYVAVRDGAEYKGTIKAKDRFAVYAKVRADGGDIIKVSRVGGLSLSTLKEINAKFSTVKQIDKILFARNLSAMLAAGLPITRALAVASRQTKSPKLKRVLDSISADVHKGESFSKAMAKHKTFSKLFVSMVRAGEEGGNLADSLAMVGKQMEKSYKLKKRIRGALIYPTIVMIAMVGIGYIMMVEVVPMLKETFQDIGIKLPASTLAFIAVSDFIVNHSITTIIIMFGSVAGFMYVLHTKIGRRVFDWIILHLPSIGTISKQLNSARFARTLSSLNASGVDIVTALGITADVVQNSFHRDVIKKAAKVVQKGEPMSELFNKADNLYPPLVGEMITVGEETGKLSDMLVRVADFYESEVDQKTQDLSTIIEPFMILFIGAGIGFFAMAMISPIYSIGDSI